MEKELQWLTDRIKEEKENLNQILGQCNVGRLPIRVFLLEHYIAAMKAEPDFNTDIYNVMKRLIDIRGFAATVAGGEDVEQAKRGLEVAVMLNEMVKA